ncbi:aldehyde dehydrogenase [Mycena belliarum]|uniref:Aldehyde dehydrogenase n=1 Tax=Mycena belliarum TaxID=1033014 RepID=A0AAD6TRU0_9AGAR|nr:aldehyde dehydrogenase [Mycena belliae]
MHTTPISDLPTIRDTLRASFKAGLTRPVPWRTQQLLQLARMAQENREAFAEAIALDIGKPKTEVYFAEVGTIVKRSVMSARALENWAKPVVVDVPDWQKAWKPTVHKAPKGTALIIAPWNYPMVLSLSPLIGAIAAGCCAIIKPSELAPHYAELLAQLLPKYLDAAAYRVVLGGVPEVTKLLELQWDHIFYTGNGRIARIISAAAAKHLTPVTLELGGKSPVIVDPSFDIALAAKRTLWAKTQNCGQFCATPDYVLIPRTHQDAFIAALKASCAEFFPQGSMKSDSISRIISPEHHARLVDLLRRTKSQVVFGGNTEGDSKIEITVFKDVSADDSLMEGEIFGPFLPIVPVDDIQDAIDFVRSRDHPLALYVFTENAALKHQILDETMSGGVAFNDPAQHLGVDELPFGGVGQSGHGNQSLKYTFDTFSYERASVDVPKEAEPFNAARYPPYTAEKFKAMTGAAFLEIPQSL